LQRGSPVIAVWSRETSRHGCLLLAIAANLHPGSIAGELASPPATTAAIY